jgi:membrane protease YdiL (CAAX protease family)
MTQTESEEITTKELSSPETSIFYYPDIKSAVGLFFMLMLYMIIVAIPGAIFLLSERILHLWFLRPIISLLMYVISFLITIRYALKKSKKVQGYYSKISFKKIQPWLVPVIIICTLALVILLEQVANWIPMPNSVEKFFEDAFKDDVFSIINITIAAPILEEILCRGVILNGLLKNYSPYKAILISAIFFGAMHLNPWQAIPAFFGGLFIGWIYYKTRSVIPGMIIHATINTTGVVFMVVLHIKNSLPSVWELPYYLIACAISIAVFAAGCIIIDKKIPTTDHPVNFDYP